MTPINFWSRDIQIQVEQTLEVAIKQAFSEGFMSGATAYAGLVGHSGLMRDNKELVKLRDGMSERLRTLFERDEAQAKPPAE